MTRAVVLFLVLSITCFPQTLKNKLYSDTDARLSLERSDIYIDKIDEKTYDIYVRKKGDIQSVMLIHSTDKENYAIRNSSFNEINGTEERKLNGEFIESERDLFFVVDSSAEEHESLASAFRLRITSPMLAGYDYNNTKEVLHLDENMSIKIRTFSRPYADYDGLYMDSSFSLTPDREALYNPSLELSHVERENGVYALYITFSGGDNRKRVFRYRNAGDDTVYKVLSTLYSENDEDARAILLENYFDEEEGKRVKIKAFFKADTNDREIYINIFDREGRVETPPVVYRIEGVDKSPEITPPVVVRRESLIREETATEEEEIPEAEEGFQIRGDVVSEFRRIANLGKGTLEVATSPKDVPEKIKSIIEETKGGEVEFVFVIDDTGSMMDDIIEVKKQAASIVGDLMAKHAYVKVGMVLYRDYTSSFLTNVYDFRDNYNDIIHMLKTKPYPKGGGDDPEAVYEGIEAAVNSFDYTLQKRIILVLGDAPPKREKLKESDIQRIMDDAKKRGIEVRLFVIAVPDVKK